MKSPHYLDGVLRMSSISWSFRNC